METMPVAASPSAAAARPPPAPAAALASRDPVASSAMTSLPRTSASYWEGPALHCRTHRMGRDGAGWAVFQPRNPSDWVEA